MKKILLLCSIIMMYCFSANAQGITPTSATIASGDDVTFKGNGESSIGYFIILTSAVVTPQGSPVTVTADGGVTYYNKFSLSPTTFKYKFVNASTSPQTVFITFTFTKNNDVNGTQDNQYNVSTAITVNGKVTAPTTFVNDAQSRTFNNTTCGAGFASDPYIYTVPKGKYSSQISLADANAKATAEINANGQNAANANTTCKLILYSDAQFGDFTRNNCGVGSTGTTVRYTVPAKRYSSLISVADANAKAVADVNANGQANANAGGTCSPVTYVRLEYSNLQTTNTGFEIEKSATLTIKFYQDAACTQPLAITSNMGVVIKQTAVRTESTLDPNGTTTTNTTYNALAGANNYSLGFNFINISPLSSSHGDHGGGTTPTGSHGILSYTYTVLANNNLYFPVASTPPNF